MALGGKKDGGEGIVQKPASPESIKAVEQIKVLISSRDEKKLLGLDEPKNEISFMGGTERVPKIVEYIKSVSDQDIPVIARELFRFYGLDEEVQANPMSIFNAPPRGRSAVPLLRAALLRLVGVLDNLVREFFRIPQKYDFSASFTKALKNANRQRELFAFSHPDEFSTEAKRAIEVIKSNGLDPVGLFEEGDIPPFGAWRTRHGSKERPFLLEEALVAIALALEGKTNAIDINRIFKKTRVATRNLFLDLTPQAREMVQAKIKKGV